jgi:hypothetical protein
MANTTAGSKDKAENDPDAEEFGESSLMYRAIQDLKRVYGKVRTDTERAEVHDLAEECRRIGRLVLKSPLALPEVIQEMHISNTERVLSMAYMGDASVALWMGQKAFDDVKKRFGNDGGTRGEGDAYRHVLWSARLRQRTNENFAKLWLNAHEYGVENNFSSEGDFYMQTQMDLHNNSVGMQLGADAPDDATIQRMAVHYLNAGRLMKIQDNKLIPTNGGMTWRSF